jgi:hypothetical protein
VTPSSRSRTSSASRAPSSGLRRTPDDATDAGARR